MNIPLVCGTSKNHGVYIEDGGSPFRRKSSVKIAQQPILVHSQSLNALDQLSNDVGSTNQILGACAAPSKNKEAVLDESETFLNVAVECLEILHASPHGRSKDENWQKSNDASFDPVYVMHVDPSINYGRKIAECIQLLQENGNISIYQISREKMLKHQIDIMKEAEEMTSKEKDHLSDQQVTPMMPQPEKNRFQLGLSQPDVLQKVNTLINLYSFTTGIGMAADEISTAIRLLNKDINIFVKNSDYEIFLKSYGSMSGKGYHFLGPLTCSDCSKSRIKYVVAVQNGFVVDYKLGGNDGEIVKFLWLVAYHEDDFYFIDSSPKGKGYVYSMGMYSGVKKFVKSFGQFLDKVLKVCDDSSDSEDW